MIIILNKQLYLQVTILNINNSYGIKYSYQIQIIFRLIYMTHKETLQVLPLHVREDLEVMTMKKYSTHSTFRSSLELTQAT